jgi:hypothetical protein
MSRPDAKLANPTPNANSTSRGNLIVQHAMADEPMNGRGRADHPISGPWIVATTLIAGRAAHGEAGEELAPEHVVSESPTSTPSHLTVPVGAQSGGDHDRLWS